VKRIVPLIIASAILALTIVAACQQSKGDRCQIDADCKDGLVCNKATNTCQETTGGGIDATVPDAPIDMMPDT
jgi:hypothetical protein